MSSLDERPHTNVVADSLNTRLEGEQARSEMGNADNTQRTYARLGEVAGGPDQIHLALKSALSPEGTLMMYASALVTTTNRDLGT